MHTYYFVKNISSTFIQRLCVEGPAYMSVCGSILKIMYNIFEVLSDTI